ncbi:MAG: hypothetical protein IPH44_25870 [Myxococcales bacterium]|nr:hypothetical protein [Myxococcales bacterium]
MIAQGDHLLVFVWNIAYAVDPSLTAWTRLAALPARVRWGRPDAVGAYPAIVDAVVLPDGAAVIATVRDGLFRIDRSGAVTAHTVAGPIAFAPGRAYVSDGAAVIDDDGALWRRVADRWEALTVPATITRATEVTFVPQPHGAGLVAVDTWDGLRMLAWGAGAATVADAGPAEASYPQVVGVGDEVWRVGAGTLWRWQPDGTWQEAGHYVERDDDHPRRGDVAMPVRLAGAQVGAHRLIVDGWHRRLLRLTIGGRGGATLADVGAAERVIALDAERALVIAGGVAQVYVAATGRLTPYPVALPPVIAAALDAGGRLWVATARGLVLIEGDVARAVPVPALTGRTIVDLIADPAGGVTATLGAGGLVRVTFD